MIKSSGLVLILLICTLSGFFKSYSFKRRVKELEIIKRYIEKIMLEIRYSMKPIPEILEKIEHSGLSLLNEFLFVDKNNSMNDIYLRSKQRTKNQMFLQNDDWFVLDAFFSSLGKSDLEGQIALCEKTLILIDKQLKQADELQLKYSKMYSSTGFLIGLFLVIIFI